MVTNHWDRAEADGALDGVPRVAYRPERLLEISPGVQIACDEFGQQDAPVVLLVMGLGMQMLGWEEGFCARIADAGFRVVRFDNRDVGRSTRWSGHRMGPLSLARVRLSRKPADRVPYLLTDMAMDAVNLLDALDIPGAHVFGCSMGGMIAQLMAAQHGDRVLSLTSMMSTSGSSKLKQPPLSLYRRLIKPIPTNDLAGYQQRWLQNWALLSGPAHPIDRNRLAARCTRSFERGPSPGGFMRQAAAIIASGSRRHILREIDVPTLVIHGDSDPLVLLEGGRDTANHVAGATMEVIEGMGHSFPPSTWPSIIGLLEKHMADAQGGAV